MPDILNVNWARRAVERIEAAIGGWNAAHSHPERLSVSWGWFDDDRAAWEENRPEHLQRQEGILACHESESEFDLFMVSIFRRGDAELPDTCKLSIGFDEEILFPSKPKAIFNLLGCSSGNVKIEVFPSTEQRKGLLVSGLEVAIPVESITSCTLGAAIADLRSTFRSVRGLMVAGQGIDHWAASIVG